MFYQNKFCCSIELEKTNVYKDLGVWIDEDLSWKYHIEKLSLALSRTAGILQSWINYNL